MSNTKKTAKPLCSTSVEYVITYRDDEGKASTFRYTSRDAMRDALRILRGRTSNQYQTSKVTTVRTVQSVS